MATISSLLRTSRNAPEPDALDFTEIDQRVGRLFTMVADGVTKATNAFLADDRADAASLVADDRAVDELQWSIEAMVESHLTARRTLREGDIGRLLTVIRIVPELERSGDLVEHIALRTGRGLSVILTPGARALTASMGERVAQMWRIAAAAYATGDAAAADEIRDLDDEVDDLHVSLTAELSETTLPTAVAIELGLLARFFERLGDHAVNVTRRSRSTARRA